MLERAEIKILSAKKDHSLKMSYQIELTECVKILQKIDCKWSVESIVVCLSEMLISHQTHQKS